MTEPYLSIVIVGRNDNYGGDFTNRLQNCIDWNTKWLEHYGVETEVLFINWNPIPDEPQIIDKLRWPAGRKHVVYRIITVPRQVHEQFIDPTVRDTVPLFEFIAKNVGIRRAVGTHILCINADVLVHPKIIRFIARKKLDGQTYYRADRWDYQDARQIEVNAFYTAGISVLMKGFQYSLTDLRFKRLRYAALQLYNNVRIGWNLWKYQNQGIANYFGFNMVYNNGSYFAHCHASGDFMLTSRNNWLALKGYPEYTSSAVHTDSVLTIIAFSKFAEHVFQVPVFHQAHERRYEWSDYKANEKFKNAYRYFEDVANSVKRKESIEKYLNKQGWGLENTDLMENRF